MTARCVVAGIGNWVDVATVVGTKSKPQCEFHYYAHYINTANGVPIPDVTRAVSKTKFVKKEGEDKEKENFDECVEAAVAGAGRFSFLPPFSLLLFVLLLSHLSILLVPVLASLARSPPSSSPRFCLHPAGVEAKQAPVSLPPSLSAEATQKQRKRKSTAER